MTGDPKGDWTTLDGNQIGALLAAFIMKEAEAEGRLRSDHYLVTTLVSSQMPRALAVREGCFEVVGGIQRLPEHLTCAVKQRGGEIRSGEPVEAIGYRDGAIRAIQTPAGTRPP